MESSGCSRPKRRATNAHAFRYLQTRNPSKLEENDLKRALEASLEECPDFWPEDSASCSSSEQSNATSLTASSSSCSSRSSDSNNSSRNNTKRQQLGLTTTSGALRNTKRRSKCSSSAQPETLQQNHLCNRSKHNHQHPSQATNAGPTFTAQHNCCPQASVHNRYKPVAKKNIYNEADFFHDGIMQYIEYQLTMARKADSIS